MKKFIPLLLILLASCAAEARKNDTQKNDEPQFASIAFYNFENLLDTIANNPKGRDIDFTPQGAKQWTSQRYWQKIENLAYCISQMTTASTPDGPAIIGVSEVENIAVLRDLVADKRISKLGLQIVHHDSPEARGMDVALLYNPKYFRVENVVNHRLRHVNFRTRDQMCVVGSLLGQRFAVIVNHWPSRLGGQAQSSPDREAAARLTRQIADSLWHIDSDLAIVVMGDLNDNPYDKAVAQVLGAKQYKKDVGENGFYNPWWDIIDNGKGTTMYKGDWMLYDQIILSGALLTPDPGRWHFLRAEVFDKPFLLDTSRKRRGQPLRTYSGDDYHNGYSDHLPVLVFLARGE